MIEAWSVPVAVSGPPVTAPTRVPPTVAAIAPAAAPESAESWLVIMTGSMNDGSELVVVTVREVPPAVRASVAPSEPGVPDRDGVPAKWMVDALALSARVMVRVPLDIGNAAAEISFNRNTALPVEMPPAGTLPAEVTDVDADTDEAAIVASSDATSDAASATLVAFFMRLKEGPPNCTGQRTSRLPSF